MAELKERLRSDLTAAMKGRQTTVVATLRMALAAVNTGGQTAVMVTHDPVAASHADRVVFLADGQVVTDLARQTAGQIAERMTHLGAWARPQQAAAPGRVA